MTIVTADGRKPPAGAQETSAKAGSEHWMHIRTPLKTVSVINLYVIILLIISPAAFNVSLTSS